MHKPTNVEIIATLQIIAGELLTIDCGNASK